MGIQIDNNTKLLVQGITGSQGQLHTRGCRDYGTNIVAGVTPGKGGQDFEGIPIYNTVQEAVNATGANASMILFRLLLLLMQSWKLLEQKFL